MTTEMKSDCVVKDQAEVKSDSVVKDKGIPLLDADSLITVLDYCDVFDLANCTRCGIRIIEEMLRPNSLIWRRIQSSRADYDVFFGQRMGIRLDAMAHCVKVRERLHAYTFATDSEKALYEQWRFQHGGKQEISVIVTGNRKSGVTSVTECLRYGRVLGEVQRLQSGTGRELRLLWRFIMFRSEKGEEFPFKIKYKEIRGDMRASPFSFSIYEGRCSMVAVFSLTDKYALQRLGEQFNYTIKTTKLKKGLFHSLPKVIVANKCDLPESEHLISKADAKTFAAQYNATLIWGSALTGWNTNAINIHALGPQYQRMLERTRNGQAL